MKIEQMSFKEAMEAINEIKLGKGVAYEDVAHHYVTSICNIADAIIEEESIMYDESILGCIVTSYDVESLLSEAISISAVNTYEGIAFNAMENILYGIEDRLFNSYDAYEVIRLEIEDAVYSMDIGEIIEYKLDIYTKVSSNIWTKLSKEQAVIINKLINPNFNHSSIRYMIEMLPLWSIAELSVIIAPILIQEDIFNKIESVLDYEAISFMTKNKDYMDSIKLEPLLDKIVEYKINNM